MPRGDVEQKNYGLLFSKVADLVLPNILDRWCLSLEGSQEFWVKSSRILIDNTIFPKAEVPTRWLRVVPIKSRRSNSWDKPIQNRMQKAFGKGYLRRESAANMLPRSSQRKKLSRESKEMLRRKVKEIKAYNISHVRATIKEKKNGNATTRKERRAHCYVCRKRGHMFRKCPNKKNRIIAEVPAKDNNSKKPTIMRTEEKLKYPERVHVITDYMIEGTDYSN
nr:ARID DNA-binding domain-containing protein [Tanacetum cinerariifolium]